MANKTSEDNPFFLPIGLTGFGQQDILLRGMLLVLLAWVILFVGGWQAVRAGLVSVSSWEVGREAACILISKGQNLKLFVNQLLSKPETLVYVFIALAVYWLIAKGQFAKIVQRMAGQMSLGDSFPLNSAQIGKIAAPITFLWVVVLVSTFLLWRYMLAPTDSWLLRAMRVIALGLLAQVIFIILGTSLAAAITEGHKTLPKSLSRTLSLIRNQRGRFLRGVVYTLPRWFVVIALGWVTVRAAVLLPFFISEHGVSLWWRLLQPANFWLLRVFRVVGIILGGVFLLAIWGGILKTKAHPLLRLMAIVGLVATIWGLFITPFFAERLGAQQQWHSQAYAILRGQTGLEGIGWSLKIGIFLCRVLIATTSATVLGAWFFLFPLAAGVAMFFVLRHSAEGVDFRQPIRADTSQDSSQQLFSAPGTFLFGGGGASAMEVLHPPAGWPALFDITTYYNVWPIMLAAVIIAVLGGRIIAFMPSGLSFGLAFAIVAPAVAGRATNRLYQRIWKQKQTLSNPSFTQTGGKLLLSWLFFASNILLVTVGIALVGLLGSIPVLGPIIWGGLYLFLLYGANLIVIWLVRWVPTSLFLIPAIGIKPDTAESISKTMSRAEHYAISAPWAMFSSILWGLPFALLPAGLAYLLFGIYGAVYGWSSNILFFRNLSVWTLLLTGVVVAITNSYIILRDLVGKPPSA